MAWCVKRGSPGRRTVAACVLSVCLVAAGAEDQEVDRWFNRHTDALWRPLVERFAPVRSAMTSPVENLMLPLDHHPNGRIRAQLRAKKAQLFLDGLIFAEEVSVDLMTDEGAPDGRLTAEGCLFDRKERHGYCEGKVSMEKSGDRLKGRGMYFSFEGQFIKILNDCEIRTNRMKNNFGRL